MRTTKLTAQRLDAEYRTWQGQDFSSQLRGLHIDTFSVLHYRQQMTSAETETRCDFLSSAVCCKLVLTYVYIELTT